MKRNEELNNPKDTKGTMPDAWDEKNIRNLLEIWCKIHPRGQVRYMGDPEDTKKLYLEYLNPYDHIEYMRSVVKQDRKLTGVMEKRKGDPTRLQTSLPPAFAAQLRKSYPTLLTDKRQTAWFLRHFKEFNLEARA
jgi:hypothetical protein